MSEADPRQIFNVHEAKTHLSKLIDRAHAGEEIVIAKAGEPWAKMVPVMLPAQRRRTPGGWPALRDVPIEFWTEPLPDDELAYIDDRPLGERT